MEAEKEAWLVDEFDNQIGDKHPITDQNCFNQLEEDAYELYKATRKVIGIRVSGFGVYRYRSESGLSTTMYVYDWYAPRFIDDLVQEQEIHSFRLEEIYH